MNRAISGAWRRNRTVDTGIFNRRHSLDKPERSVGKRHPRGLLMGGPENPGPCSIRHVLPGFALVPCGQPARWVTSSSRVCVGCRGKYLAHMPARLFAEVAL